jgi:hypothetical protein
MGLIYSLYEILGRYFMRKEKEEKSIWKNWLFI